MPSGIFEKEILIERKMADGKKMIIYRAGPFFDVELSGMKMGKVRKLTTELTPEGFTKTIKVGDYRITLSPKEIKILEDVIANREALRTMSYKDKLVERETVKKKLKDEYRARFNEALHGTPAMQELDKALTLERTPGALPKEELNKIKARASTDTMNRYFRGYVGEHKYASGEITDLQEALDLTASIPLKLNK